MAAGKNYSAGRIPQKFLGYLLGVALVAAACGSTAEVATLPDSVAAEQSVKAEPSDPSEPAGVQEAAVDDGVTSPVDEVLDASEEATKPIAVEPDEGPAEEAPEAVPAEPAEASSEDVSEPVADSSGATSIEGSPAISPADAGQNVAPPTCEAGTPSTFDPAVAADVGQIETNQIVESTVEKFTVDHWLIDLCAGQVLFFDSLDQCSGDPKLDWQLVVPDGDKAFGLNELNNKVWGCGGDTGPIKIPESGTYTIEVSYKGVDDRTGSYKFEVLNVPAPDVFTLELGQSVGFSDPGPGAGSLEYPGSFDRYEIALEANQRVFFDASDSCVAEGGLDWRLVVPDGDKAFALDELNNKVWGCGGDSDPITVPETGVYTIEVYYSEDSDSTAAQYGFTVVDASG